MRARRAVSPVVGVVLMVAITVLLAATVLVVAPSVGDVAMPSFADGDAETDETAMTELVHAADGDAGETDTHYVRVHVEAGSDTAGNSLNSLRVDYPSSVDAGGVTGSDVERVGVDSDGDGTLDADAMVDLDGLSTTDDNSTLTVGFGGNHDLEVGD